MQKTKNISFFHLHNQHNTAQAILKTVTFLPVHYHSTVLFDNAFNSSYYVTLKDTCWILNSEGWAGDNDLIR